MIKIIVIGVILLLIITVVWSALEYALEWIQENAYLSAIIFLTVVSLILKNFLVFVFGIVVIGVKYRYKLRKEAEAKRRAEEEKQRLIQKIYKWGENGKDLDINLDLEIIDIVDKFKQNYYGYYDYENMPEGRAMAFISNFKELNEDDDFYFFKPERTKEPYTVRENGILIAKSGIYVAYETFEGESEKTVVLHKRYLEFHKLYRCRDKDDQIKIINNNEDGLIIKHSSEFSANGKYSDVEQLIRQICKRKIPQYIKYNGLGDLTVLDEIFNRQEAFQGEIDGVVKSGVVSGNAARQKLYNETKHYMNGSAGHGYAAEYANNTIDRARGKNVINEAQNLDPITGRQVKDGADRIVDGEFIQTKYYKDDNQLFRETFPNGEVRYQQDGQPMKIEVPKDRYKDIIRKLQKKIDNGEVKVPEGTKAESLIKRGSVSYKNAQMIAISGTVSSLTFDLANGVIESTESGLISSTVVFAMAIWNGKSIEDATKAFIETGLKVVGQGAFIYTLTMQSARKELAVFTKQFNNPVFTATDKIAKSIRNSKLSGTVLGEKLKLGTLTQQALVSNTVTAALMFGPDIYKFFDGRMSGKQFAKNSVVTASAMTGAAVGAAKGTVLLGPVGSVAGAVIGGMLARKATKSVVDKFIEDDAEEMFYIYKEEYLDVVLVSQLNSEELQKISNQTLNNEDVMKFLEKMYASGYAREYARNYITDCIVDIYEKREIISNNMIELGYRQLIDV